MTPAPDRHHALARKYMWWNAPEQSLCEGPRRLIAQVMELGTWDDAHALLEAVGENAFREVLAAPPPGILFEKSWTFWHHRLRLGAHTRPAPKRLDALKALPDVGRCSLYSACPTRVVQPSLSDFTAVRLRATRDGISCPRMCANEVCRTGAWDKISCPLSDHGSSADACGSMEYGYISARNRFWARVRSAQR